MDSSLEIFPSFLPENADSSPAIVTSKVTEVTQATDRLVNILIKNVSPSSQRIYFLDCMQFAGWLSERGFTLETVNYEGLSEYRAFLAGRYKKATAGRKLVVARRLLDVAVVLKDRPDNPAKQIKGFKSGGAETPHRALTRKEALALLSKIDQSTKKGKRDFALISLLLRTGMRRSEVAALTLADLRQEQGHAVAVIQHGKGDKRRVVKLPVDVRRALDVYLESANLATREQAAPVFVSFSKGDKPTGKPITGLAIERLVKGLAAEAELSGLSPHGLRASFVTLTLEAGAKLEQVQYAVGHADPRTTERYQKRKINLDDNAVDYLRL